MSTRGAYGFFKDNTNKVIYNHFDSYPTVLGKDILNFIVENDNEKLEEIFSRMKVVDNKDLPTDEDYNTVVNMIGIEEIKKQLIGVEYTNKNEERIKIENETDIENFLKDNYYNLLCIVPTENLFDNKVNIYEDSTSFIGNSLFCEYAYILNLDTNSLEFYIGANKKSIENRYSKYASGDGDYVECRLVLTIPFDVIRQNKLLTLDILEFINQKLED